MKNNLLLLFKSGVSLLALQIVLTLSPVSGLNKALATNCSYKVRETTDDIIITIQKVDSSKQKTNFENNDNEVNHQMNIPSEDLDQVLYGDSREIAIPKDLVPLSEEKRKWKLPESLHEMNYQNGLVSIKTYFTFGKTDKLFFDTEEVTFYADPNLSLGSISKFTHNKTFAKISMTVIDKYWPSIVPKLFDEPLSCEKLTSKLVIFNKNRGNLKMKNDLGLDGIDFVEFVSPDPSFMEKIFKEFGFSKIMTHGQKNVDYYNQNDIHFFLNKDPKSFAAQFGVIHGPSISSMGWRVKDAKIAFELAVSRGAKQAIEVDYFQWPAIYGIGDSLIYFVEKKEEGIQRYQNVGFELLKSPEIVSSKGFMVIDHLTNNVYKGTMSHWSDFYKNIFGFEEVRYFDIRGEKTGLTSYALRSPCGQFCIPINEGTESKSQINEYLEEYHGPGIQHIAFLTHDILDSLDRLRGASVSMLDIDDEYYKDIFNKVPHVSEDPHRIRAHNVLVDGDENGYLLQIFTKNLFGPIFIEIIQRKNNLSFGEGNFGALFRSIERDQMKRGFLT